jgi:preprotein translocase subunit SecG
MEVILTVIHVIASLVLITIVLLQSGKGQGVAAGLGGASGAAKKMFGGGNTQTALGKATVGVGALFLATSVSLAYLSSQPDSAVDLQQGDQNFGARQGTVLEVGGDGEQGDEQTDDSAETAPSETDSDGANSGSDSSSPSSSGSTPSSDDSSGSGTGEEEPSSGNDGEGSTGSGN